MPGILSTRSADMIVKRYNDLPALAQSRLRVRSTSGTGNGRSVRAQAWRFPILELKAAASDAISGVDDASEAIASAVTAGADPSSLPPELLALGGVAALVVVGVAALASKGSLGGDSGSTQRATPGSKANTLVRENCVLVFGASGRSGQACVKALLAAGRSVVAACRSSPDLGMKAGEQDSGAVLFIEKGVDVTKANTIKPGLFKGVTQVVITSAASPAPGGQGFAKGQDPESVDANGVENVVKQALEMLPPSERTQEPVLKTEDFSSWESKDDTVMGGSSSSAIAVQEGTSVAEWKGNLVVEDGGFCGISSATSHDLSAYDGVTMRVKGSGETFKMNLKNPSQDGKPLAYQATFDTVAGEWVTVTIPWHEFVPVDKASVDMSAPPLDISKISSLGLVYSRFDFNGASNPNFKPGEFSLEIDGGISAYSEPRPSLIQVSSASTERNALIGDDADARAADIPIVQLNPSGVMNWKYKGECAVRGSGLAYSVLRPTGLVGDVDPDEGKPYSVEFSQGDMVAGRVSRDDLAAVVVQATTEPSAVDATFEIKRTERWAPGGQVSFDGQVPKSEWLRLVQDRDRRKAGLMPLPAFVPPPEPVSEERKKEILSDARVVATMNRGGDPDNMKADAPSAEADIALRKEAVQKWIKAYQDRAPAPEVAAAPVVDAAAAADIAARKKEVQKWIESYRNAPPPPPPPAPSASANGSAAQGSASTTEEIAVRKAEVQSWIADYRSRPAGSSAKDEARAWIDAWRVGNAAQNGSQKQAGAKVKVEAR